MYIPNPVTVADVIKQFNLQHYVRILFASKSIRNPYHNVRHMLHVMMEVYRALKFYSMQDSKEARPMLIAALLHDLDHPGTKRDSDADNIRDTLDAIFHVVLDEDRPICGEICGYIWYTEFPQTSHHHCLICCILQDADLTQAFADEGWVNEIFLGLSREWFTSVDEAFIDGQIAFLRSISWKTTWAKKRYPQSVIDAKIAEYEAWKGILLTPRSEK